MAAHHRNTLVLDESTHPVGFGPIAVVLLIGTAMLVASAPASGKPALIVGATGAVMTMIGLAQLWSRDRWLRGHLYIDDRTGMLTRHAFFIFCRLELNRCERSSLDSMMAALRFPSGTSVRDVREIGRALTSGLRSYDLCHFDHETSTAFILTTNISEISTNAEPMLQRIVVRLEPYGLRYIGYELSEVFGTNVDFAIERALDAMSECSESGQPIARSAHVDMARSVIDAHRALVESCMVVLRLLPDDVRQRHEAWAGETRRLAHGDLPTTIRLVAELATLVRLDGPVDDSQVHRRLLLALELLEQRSGVTIVPAGDRVQMRQAEQLLLESWAAIDDASGNDVPGDVAA